GADEVIDYKMQDFQDVLRDYDAVLGTVRGDALEKALRILKPQSAVASLGGPPETEADWRRVADTLRRLHRLTQGWPQRPGWRSSTDLLHVETGTRIDLGAMPPEGVARCRAAWARLAGRPACVVHGDLRSQQTSLIDRHEPPSASVATVRPSESAEHFVAPCHPFSHQCL